MEDESDNERVSKDDAEEIIGEASPTSSNSKRTWIKCLMLLTTILVYLFIGALAFRALERPVALQAASDFEEALQRFDVENDCMNETDVAKIIYIVTTAIGEGAYSTGRSYASQLTVNKTFFEGSWSVGNSFYFAGTVVSTIGTGNLAPHTTLGETVCMFYAVIGIAMTGGIIFSIGKLLEGLCLNRINISLRSCLRSWSRAGLGLQLAADTILVYLFMMVPCSLIYFFTQSDWSYIDSFYYSHWVATTIGFGDLQASFIGPSVTQMYLIKIALYTYLFICLGAVSTLLDVYQEAQQQGTGLISSHLQRYRRTFLLRRSRMRVEEEDSQD